MRGLFATALIAMSAACVPLAYGSNQEVANRIAESIGEAYPQYTIEVAYKNGNVRLRGEVGSEMDRQRIAGMVSQIPSVQSVSSDSIRVAQNTAVPQNMAAMPVSAQLPVVPQGDTFGGYNNMKVAQNMNTVTTDAASTMSDSFAIDSAQVPNTSLQTGPIQGGVQFGNEVNYSPAPQGLPVTAGHNGQNGEPNLPNYAWPTTADYPNYAQLGYPKQYAASAFPYIGPFYPYPQVPLGWRKVTMEWHDGYWWLDFNDGAADGPFSPLFRQPTKYR